MVFIPPLEWAKPHCDPIDNLKGTRFSNPWLWWQEAKKTKCVNTDGFTQHTQSLLGASVLSAALQWSGVECSAEFSVRTGHFKHLLCPIPWHLATWRYWALETWWVWLKNWTLFSYTCRVTVPCGWVSTLSISADPDWGGYCCPVSSPGTPAASVHTPGKRLRELPWWLSSKEYTCQCKRHERCGFDSWVKKNPSRREWQPTPGFLPGESHAERSLVSYTASMGLQRVKHDWIDLALTHTASSGKWHHTGYLKQNILHLFILPTSIAFIIVSWKAFCFKYSSVHMSVFKFQSLSLPMFPLCNSKFVL